MRFVVDECVDARVARVLSDAGHEAWTIPRAGLAAEDDDEVSVYADDHHAVLVTDDKALRKRRAENLFGRMLFLRCTKMAAVGVVESHVEAIVALLEAAESLIVSVSVAGPWIDAPRWLRTVHPL